LEAADLWLRHPAGAVKRKVPGPRWPGRSSHTRAPPLPWIGGSQMSSPIHPPPGTPVWWALRCDDRGSPTRL